MSELSELYGKRFSSTTRTRGTFARSSADRTADGNNPLCGDALRVYVDLEGDTVKDVAFKGSGCAISKASASMMTQVVKGKSKDEAEKLFDEFHRMVTGGLDVETEDHLGKLKIFAGVLEFPARVKCVAELAYAHAALHGEEVVSTE